MASAAAKTRKVALVSFVWALSTGRVWLLRAVEAAMQGEGLTRE